MRAHHPVCNAPQDEHGAFLEAGWQSAVSALPMPKPPKQKSEDEEAAAVDPTEPKALQRRAAEVLRVAAACDKGGMLPAIVFCFSRKECEIIAKTIAKSGVQSGAGANGNSAGADGSGGDGSSSSGGGWTGGAGGVVMELLEPEAADRVQMVFDCAVQTLASEDAALPQVSALLPLLRRGVGLHHSGMLPLMRELVEILFAEVRHRYIGYVGRLLPFMALQFIPLSSSLFSYSLGYAAP